MLVKKEERYQGLFFQFLEALSSPTFGTFLLAIMFFLILLSLVIPQKGFSEAYDEWSRAYPILVVILERLGLTDIFDSNLFLLLIVLIFLSIIICTINRLRRIRSQSAKWAFIRGVSEEIFFEGESLEVLREKFRRWFTKKLFFYQVREKKGRAIFFASSSWKKLVGSVLFHFSVLLIGLGFLVTRLYSLEGSLILVEGEVVRETPQTYYRIATGRFFRGFEGFKLTLLGVFERYERGTLVQSEADVTLISDRQRIRKIIAPNYPLFYQDYRIVLKRVGPAPQIIISKNGEVVVSSFAKLIELKNGYHINTFSFPQEDLTVTIEQKFYSDNYIVTVCQKEIRKKFKVRSEEPIQVLNYQIVISTGRKWCEFFVVKDSGYPITNVGFCFALIGLAITTLVSEERVYVLLLKVKNNVKGVIVCQRKRWRGKWEPFKRSIDIDLIKKLKI